MAEQVPAGSYTTAEDVKNSELNKLSKDIITIIADINKLGYDFRVSEEDSNRFKEIFLSIKEPLNTLKSEVKEDENIDESKNKIKTFLDNIENDPSDQISSLETSINEVEEDGIITKIKTDFDALINDLKNFVDDLSSVTSLLLFLEDISILASGAEYLLKGYACTRKQMTLKPETTDNFGNRLITDKVYVPVVLSNINDTSVEENTQFSNALSDFQNTEEFTYITTNQIDLINFKTLSS